MNWTHNKRSQTVRGMAPLVMAVIIGVIVLIAGVGGYVAYQSRQAASTVAADKKAATDNGAAAVSTGTTNTAVDTIQINAPQFEVPSVSALPKLQASAFNIKAGSLPATGIVKDFTANTSTNYSYKLDIPMPKVTIDVPTAPAAPVTVPTAPVTPPPASPPTGGSGGAGTTVNASTCAQFASMPSAQYCSMVGDPNGAKLCQDCKAAGL